MKAITTRSGVAYEGPSIPTNPSPKKVVERETDETTDKEQSNFQGSTAHIPPSVNSIPIPEPDVPKTLPKPNIPYPSRRNDQKTVKKLCTKRERFFKMFSDLRFDIRFGGCFTYDARFAPMIRNLLMNKEKFGHQLMRFWRSMLLEIAYGFSNKSSSGGKSHAQRAETPLTSEFILEEIEAYLKDDLISPEIDHGDC
ncbi:hypothetical protein Tco_0842979 [Tanacetum coccineum]|uniref:Reverse transcriptase domain-containing protein n=1 Tax=Tanacetum coccineum TaxID=301880 RepID=A0ABQ5B4C4_9ASTR